MTLVNKINFLDKKNEANEAKYNMDRKTANISILSSGKLDKHEYKFREDLGYKFRVVEQVKLKYSPLGQIFNKGLEKDDKKDEVKKKRLKM